MTSPARVLLNHEPKVYYAERISLRDFVARFKDAIASEDECAADDLLYNYRIGAYWAYRIGGRVFQHRREHTTQEAT